MIVLQAFFFFFRLFPNLLEIFFVVEFLEAPRHWWWRWFFAQTTLHAATEPQICFSNIDFWHVQANQCWPFNVTKRHKNPKKFQQLSSNWHVCTKIFVLLVPGNFDCFSCDDLKLNRHASGKINCRLIAALCFVIENFPCEIETVYCN